MNIKHHMSWGVMTLAFLFFSSALMAQVFNFNGIIRASAVGSFGNWTEIGHDNANGYINARGNGRLDFRLDGTTRMSLTDQARLGINTTNPIAQLDVRGNNIFLGPSLPQLSVKFAAIGESGGIPGGGGNLCDLYGFRAQRATNNAVNLGLDVDFTPLILWENPNQSFEIRNGSGINCGNLVAQFTGPNEDISSLTGLKVFGNVTMSERLGVGIHNPIAQADIRGDNLFLAPSADADDPTQGKFVALGESGGSPSAPVCNLYGLRTQLNPTDGFNFGIQAEKRVPTILWNNGEVDLEFNFDNNISETSCGFTVARLGPTAAGGTLGLFVNGRGVFRDRVGIRTSSPTVELDVRGNNILLSPNGSPAGKFVGLGESGGPGGTNCQLYGYRAQLDPTNSVNVGVNEITKQPTVLWNNTASNLEFRNGTSASCGTLVLSIGGTGAEGLGILVNGDVNLNGGVWQSETPRSNRNAAKTIDRALDKVLSLEGQQDQDVYAIDYAGLERQLPELVRTNEDGTHSVNMTGMIPVLVEAFEDQQEVIDVQYEIIDEQSREMAAMQDRLNRLEAMVNTLVDQQSANSNTSTIAPAAASRVVLATNRPNPFEDVTVIDYVLPEDMIGAKLMVYSINGQPVADFALAPGEGQIEFDASNLSNGTYLYAIFADGKVVAQQQMAVQR